MRAVLKTTGRAGWLEDDGGVQAGLKTKGRAGWLEDDGACRLA